MVSRKKILEDNEFLKERQYQLRRTADILTAVWAEFSCVEAIGLTGSVAKPLWKEVPRFSEYRRQGIELWHESKDVDLVLWLDDFSMLKEMRRAKAVAMRGETLNNPRFGIADYMIDAFIFDPITDGYIGRLCNFNQCPKHRKECTVPGCGDIPYNRIFPSFTPWPSLLSTARETILFTRESGAILNAIDLPLPDEQPTSASILEMRRQA